MLKNQGRHVINARMQIFLEMIIYSKNKSTPVKEGVGPNPWVQA